MKNSNLPAAPAGRPRSDVGTSLSPRALAQWDTSIRAADEKDNTISILDVIGQDFWTGEGVTAKRIAGALRAIGSGPVTVNVNSPGGDLFEGLAIYNMLREHQGEVTVKVLGIAASAASIIAMAGDKVQIARAGFLMIHNAWVMAIGNRHDLRSVADTLEPFDEAMADIYATRTGEDRKTIHKSMDNETWIGGSAAVERGFADALLDSDEIGKEEAKAKASAARRMESALRASGLNKAQAITLISQFKSDLAVGGVSGDPDMTGAGDPAAFREIAAIAASLTRI